jgi:hypothetical protein
MFFDFGNEGFISLIVITLVCLLLFMYLRKSFRSRIKIKPDLVNIKYGVFLLTIGLILSSISLIFHLYFQIDLARSPGLMKIFYEITASPILYLTIVFFLIGLTMLLIGISVTSLMKAMLDKSS